MNDSSDSVDPLSNVTDPATRTVFVTGATGLLGNNLVRELLRQGYAVRALVRSLEKARRFLADADVELVSGDMTDVSAFASALDGCSAVFHTAAYFREYYQPGDHAERLEAINVTGTRALMEEADRRGVGLFVHTSSSGAVGMKPDGSPGDEDTAATGEMLENGYFNSKVRFDEYLRTWKPAGGMKVVEILPGWMWGPGDAAPTAAGQLTLDFVKRKIPVIPEGGTNLVDARDVAMAAARCIGRAEHGDRFIVAGDFHTVEEALRELQAATSIQAPTMRAPYAFVMAFAWFQEQISRLTGRPLLVSREAVRLMRARHTVSSERARKRLGATFRPLSETVRDVVGWYTKHGFIDVPVPASTEPQYSR